MEVKKNLIKPVNSNTITKLTPTKTNAGSVEEFVSKLFASRDIMHMRHLNPTKSGLPSSYAEHKALNEYYDSLIDFIDSFVESYQGKHGLLEFEILRTNSEEPISHLSALVKYIEDNKDSIFPDSYLNNQVDELISLIYSTLYKLKYLK